VEDGEKGRYKLTQTRIKSIQTMKNKGPQSEIRTDLFNNPQNSDLVKLVSGVLQVTLREDYGMLIKLREMAESTHPSLAFQIHPGTLVRNSNAVAPLTELIQKRLMHMVSFPRMNAAEFEDFMTRRIRLLVGLS
jgi:hypothetical protein